MDTKSEAIDTFSSAVYVNKHFEIRDHGAPTKYVFNGDTRVVHVTGSLSTNVRVQRLRVYPGWSLCSVAVAATNVVSQFSASNPQLVRAIYRWVPQTTNYAVVGAGDALAAGTVFWLEASTNAVVSVTGAYSEPTNLLLSAGGAFVPSAGLEAWPVSNMWPASVTAWKPVAQSNAWEMRFASPLESLSDLPSFIAPGEAPFVQSDSLVQLLVPDSTLRVQWYHPDHLESSSCISDTSGNLVDESGFYPFGAPRSRFFPGNVPVAYGFEQKEQDRETDLVYFEARYLTSGLGRFATCDPLLCHRVQEEPNLNDGIEVNSPQRLNYYAFVHNRPLIFADPTGQKVKFKLYEGGRQELTRGFEIDSAKGGDLKRAKGIWKEALKARNADGSKPELVNRMVAAKKSKKTLTIQVSKIVKGSNATAAESDAAQFDPKRGSNVTIIFDPNLRGMLNGEAVERDPSASLPHEAGHAFKKMFGLETHDERQREFDAGSAENEFRKAIGLPQRSVYGHSPARGGPIPLTQY